MMTVRQAAATLGVSPSKMYQLAARRKVAHYRVDGKIFIADSDLAAYLDGCRVAATARAAPSPAPMPPLRHLRL